MIKIRILSDKTRHLKGVSKASGKPYHVRLQTGYAFTIDHDGSASEIPEKFELVLQHDQRPYEPGDYTLDSYSVYIDRNGRMSINPKLKRWVDVYTVEVSK